MTQVLSPTPEALALASQLLHDGQLVAFPTETVYGLGANALDAKAVLNIFAAKGRPADNPLIVHVYDRAQLTPLCEVSPLAEKLMDAFWPGPLTLILPRKPAIPDEVAASLPTVAVRMPSHPVAAALLRAYEGWRLKLDGAKTVEEVERLYAEARKVLTELVKGFAEGDTAPDPDQAAQDALKLARQEILDELAALEKKYADALTGQAKDTAPCSAQTLFGG